jgi:Xaa-Pro dipeptidase
VTAPHSTRVDSLRELAGRADLDAVVATTDASIAYLTGFWGLQLERLFAAVVRTDGGGALVAPTLDRDGVAAAPTPLPPRFWEPTTDGMPELVDALGGARRIGVEEHHLSFARAGALTAAGAELMPAGDLVMSLRARKDETEIARIRAACALVEEVLERMFAELRPGDVEAEVNARVRYWLSQRGATDAHPLILFGAHAGNPHGEPSDRTLAPGDVVCADVSAQLDGYWGDLTRCGTVGPAGEWARAAWAVVRDAYDAAVAATRAGAEARAVDAAQRAIVEAAVEVGQCLHGAGHAIGVEIHEPPFLVPASATPLAEGMVFTIEPGIYRSDAGGIRLEDDVLVGADGPVLLSGLPLELREIPA